MSNGERRLVLDAGSLSMGRNAAQHGGAAAKAAIHIAAATIGSGLRFAAKGEASLPSVRVPFGFGLVPDAGRPPLLMVSAPVVGISLGEIQN
jgi:hypothetical protein